MLPSLNKYVARVVFQSFPIDLNWSSGICESVVGYFIFAAFCRNLVGMLSVVDQSIGLPWGSSLHMFHSLIFYHRVIFRELYV